ncbi:MAG: PSP1 C-terminal domain-containing protein, partial [Fuerstiella sp.]
MISANRVDEAAVAQDVQHDSSAADLQPEEVQPENVALVRYGLIPQVARFGLSDELKLQLEAGERRGLKLVVTSDRGVEVADLLEIVRKGIITTDNPVTGEIQRIATDADLATHAENRKRAELEFFDWQQRVSDWQLQLQIIDVEWTLEADQVVLYV